VSTNVWLGGGPATFGGGATREVSVVVAIAVLEMQLDSVYLDLLREVKRESYLDISW
jgi:hypothetical protein